MIEAVIWDIDGVLVESEPLHREKIGAIAADPLRTAAPSAQGVVIVPSDWDELHGRGDHYIYDWIKQRSPDYPLSEQEFLKTCESYYLDHAGGLKRRPGALEAFNIFAGKGLPQVAVTSGVRAQMEANLKAAGVAMLFALSADDVKNKKPDPEGLNKAYDLMKRAEAVSASLHDKKNCIVIGDSPSDVEAASRAGMTGIYWKLSKEQKDSPFADYTVSTADDFIALVVRLAL